MSVKPCSSHSIAFQLSLMPWFATLVRFTNYFSLAICVVLGFVNRLQYMDLVKHNVGLLFCSLWLHDHQEVLQACWRYVSFGLDPGCWHISWWWLVTDKLCPKSCQHITTHPKGLHLSLDPQHCGSSFLCLLSSLIECSHSSLKVIASSQSSSDIFWYCLYFSATSLNEYMILLLLVFMDLFSLCSLCWPWVSDPPTLAF